MCSSALDRMGTRQRMRDTARPSLVDSSVPVVREDNVVEGGNNTPPSYRCRSHIPLSLRCMLSMIHAISSSGEATPNRAASSLVKALRI